MYSCTVDEPIRPHVLGTAWCTMYHITYTCIIVCGPASRRPPAPPRARASRSPSRARRASSTTSTPHNTTSRRRDQGAAPSVCRSLICRLTSRAAPVVHPYYIHRIAIRGTWRFVRVTIRYSGGALQVCCVPLFVHAWHGGHMHADFLLSRFMVLQVSCAEYFYDLRETGISHR